MKKYLIINADDFGLCADVNSAIIDLLEKSEFHLLLSCLIRRTIIKQ